MRNQKVFRVYHLAWSVDPQQKHLLRVEKLRPADWLVCQSTRKFVVRQVVCLMKTGQQSQNFSLKVDPSSNFRNNFLQHATNAFVARQVYHSWWKTGNIDEKIATTSWGFSYPVFRRLKWKSMICLIKIIDWSIIQSARSRETSLYWSHGTWYSYLNCSIFCFSNGHR